MARLLGSLRFGGLAVAVMLAMPLPAEGASQVDACLSSAEEGQRLQKSAKLVAARARFLVCARETCPRSVANDCKSWLSEVNKSMSSIVVRAVDARGGELEAVKVSLDGEAVVDKLDGKPIEIDPGRRAFRFESNGQTIEQPIIVRQGERNRLVDVRFDRVNAVTPSILAPAEPVPGPVRTPPPVDPDTHESTSHLPPIVWVLGVAGVALGATGGVLWVLGHGEHDDLAMTCGISKACTMADESSARTKITVGDVAVVTGVVAIAAAIGIAIMSHGSTSVSTRATSLRSSWTPAYR